MNALNNLLKYTIKNNIELNKNVIKLLFKFNSVSKNYIIKNKSTRYFIYHAPKKYRMNISDEQMESEKLINN